MKAIFGPNKHINFAYFFFNLNPINKILLDEKRYFKGGEKWCDLPVTEALHCRNLHAMRWEHIYDCKISWDPYTSNFKISGKSYL